MKYAHMAARAGGLDDGEEDDGGSSTASSQQDAWSHARMWGEFRERRIAREGHRLAKAGI
jgi:hypothetical protein